jgi:O-antigen ligase
VTLALRSCFSVFIFIAGATALVMPRGYSLGFLGACLLALLLWLPKRESLIDVQNKWFVLPCIAYGVGHMAIGLVHQWAWRSLDAFFPFVLLTLGVWGIRRYKPNMLFFWCGLAVGAIGAACLAGYQSIVLAERSGGFNHPIQFGNAALLMGVLCLVRLLMVRGNRWLDLLMALGFYAGFAASVWSQSRGGWLAVLLIIAWILINASRGWHPFRRVIASVVLLSLLAIPVLQPNNIVQHRVKSAMMEFQDYIESKTQGTSVGARLAMWKFASQEIASAPFIGVGIDGWKQSRDNGIKSGALDPFMKNFHHLHNEFIDTTYKSGFIGLLLLLGLYCLPMLMFFKPYLHGYVAEVKALAMVGMVIPMMYMDFGLTQTFLSHNSGRMILCSLWMCAAALMLNAVEDNQTHEPS